MDKTPASLARKSFPPRNSASPIKIMSVMAIPRGVFKFQNAMSFVDTSLGNIH
jgi:hypothetical protein